MLHGVLAGGLILATVSQGGSSWGLGPRYVLLSCHRKSRALPPLVKPLTVPSPVEGAWWRPVPNSLERQPDGMGEDWVVGGLPPFRWSDSP